MKHPPLTAAALRNVKLPETGKIYLSDGACPGLRLRVSASGKMAWILTVRDQAGRVRSIALGDYNGAGCVGLADARERARKERQKLKDGKDIVAERKAARANYQARKDAPTLATLLEQYDKHVVAERQKVGGARSWPEALRAINSVLKKFVHLPLCDFSAPLLQQQIDNWPSRARAGATVRFIRPILKWAARRGMVASGIAEQLQQPEGSNIRRQRVLSDDEIKAIWQALPITGGSENAFKWLFWTCCRKSEMIRATWRDIDLKAGTWTIPAEHAKNGRELVVPLPRQALEILKEKQTDRQPDDLLFPNRNGGSLDNWDRVTKRLQIASGTGGWHRHDIRRTCATLLGDLGTMPHIIERVLNHVLATGGDGSALSSVARTYNISRYREDHAQALQRLADRLDAITGSNIRSQY
ncbi:tyrosine-type recombinase/integrase [Acetobacter pasteurianus]|uniref:tyrosine-type recombinase/integrase n=1 Tax=Acetobacter pasteurianus TaxID=438 RepID=UPI0003842045|nr:site-specific integrase [Acetobacter pasteurianus]CCT58802.1 phage integrase family protein [Acetobacter pasteurianus 386B]